jgi:hypothetical protein
MDMRTEPFKIPKPQKYDIATEVISSAIRVLKAVGFSEEEVPLLFDQVTKRGVRAPLWLEPL